MDYNEYNELNNDESYHIVINNLDNFFIQVYSYYSRKGLFCIFLEEISNFFLSFFLMFFITFLTSFINYEILNSTYNLEKSIDINFDNINLFLKLSLLVFSILWIRQFISLFYSLHENLKIKKFFNEQLKIDEDELKTIRWNDIVIKLIKLPYLSSNDIQLDPLNVTNRIMRKENYLISMINDGIFNFNYTIPIINYKIDLFTKTIEWGIYLTVLDYLFEKDNRLKKDFISGNKNLLINTLNYRFRLLGFFGLILSPFILFFLITYYIFRYAEEYRSYSNKINTREWNFYTKWRLRELNELNIVFQERINESYNYATNYVKQFHSYPLNILSRFFYFIGSSFLIVLVSITFLNEDYLNKLYITEGKTCLWYIGILGTILSVVKNSIFDVRTTFHPNTEMTKVVEYTHFFPKHWRHNVHKYKIYKEFVKMYEYRIFIYFKEIIGVIFTPFILFFHATNYSEKIINFVKKHSVENEDLGYICSYATFDFQKYGDINYGSAYEGTDFKSKNGKMEKSFLNFKKQYPDWTVNGGDELVENIYKYNTSIQLRNSDNCTLTNSEKFKNNQADFSSRNSLGNIDNIFNSQLNFEENKGNMNVV